MLIVKNRAAKIFTLPDSPTCGHIIFADGCMSDIFHSHEQALGLLEIALFTDEITEEEFVTLSDQIKLRLIQK